MKKFYQSSHFFMHLSTLLSNLLTKGSPYPLLSMTLCVGTYLFFCKKYRTQIKQIYFFIMYLVDYLLTS